MNPGILFLDEPTTGLDASAALAVMTTVRELAQRISVICTIHQVCNFAVVVAIAVFMGD